MTSTLAATAFVLFFIQGALGVEESTKKTIINVDIYYEALCGDSIMFITNQLVPAYEKLHDHLYINFIPYGKATHERYNESTPWIFDCQHGEAECKGNKDQACALHAIQQNEFENSQQLSVKLVGCVMGSSYPATAVPSCVKQIGLLKETSDQIDSCRGSPLADELLVAYGEKTAQYKSPLTFVPTIIVDGENRPNVRRDFQGVICGLLPQEEKNGCTSV